MIEEVIKNIYRIGVPLTGNPLKELNSYLIKGDDHDLLIDTGFRVDECREFLDKALLELGSDKEKRDVLITHLHSDHSGLANEMAGKNRKIYTGKDECIYLQRCMSDEIGTEMDKRMISEGMPMEKITNIKNSNPARKMQLSGIDERFTPVIPGTKLKVGDYELTMVDAAGHTPGNMMVWIEKEGIMFTGDHILFDITPNITSWPDVVDALGNYLTNLRKASDYDVRLALPGHRKNGDYQERIAELIHHHEERLQGVVRIITAHPGMNAYEITALMKWEIRARNWEDFPDVQKWFAMGECLSHLDYLRVRQVIQRVKKENVWHYYMAE